MKPRIAPPDFSKWSQDKKNAWFAEGEEIARQAKNGGGQVLPAPLPLVPPAPAAQPYPVNALGAVLSAAALAIAAKCQCALALAAQAVLAVASLVAQRLADVLLPYGQTRPLSLFFTTVAASGDRKSTADNEALAPVRAYERNGRQAYELAWEAWRIAHAAWAAQHRKIENDKTSDRLSREADLSALGPAPVEPIKPMMTAPEPTVEALAKFWPALPGALGLFSAEGGQLTGGHGFGPDHRLKTAAALSTLWDGSGIRRLRAGDGITDLPGRRLALHLMVQPEAAAGFLSEPILRDQGLLSRLLIAAPETLAGSRLYVQPAEDMAAPLRRYFACIMDLLERPAPAANAAGNELTPRPLGMSEEARGLWVRFHDAIEKRMAPEQSLEGLRDVGAKAAENAARIAGVLAIVANAEAQEIDGPTMRDACALMSWYLSEALRLSGVARQTPALRNAVKLSDWLRAKSKTDFTLREVMNSGPNALRSKAAAEQAIAQLEEHGHVEKRGEGRAARWAVQQDTGQ